MDRKKPLLLRPEVFGLLAIAFCAELGIAVLNISAMPVYLTFGRGFTALSVSLALGAFLLSEALFKSYAGALADKLGRRPFLIAAPCILIFTPLLTVWTPASWGNGAMLAILGLRVIDGIAAAMLWPSAYASVAEAVEENEKGKALAMLNGCFMVGVALGLPLGGIVNVRTGSLDASFYLASCLFVIAATTAYYFVRRQRRRDGKEDCRHDGHAIQDLIVCFKTIPMILITALVLFIGVGLPMAIVKLFAQNTYKLNEEQFGLLVLPAALAMAFLSWPMGAWGERMGRDKAVRIGLTLCAIGIWFVAFGDWFEIFRSPLVVGGASLLVGVGFLLALPAWYATVSAINPQKSGSYLGAVMSVQGFGAIIGLLIGGKLFDIDNFLPFIFCAVAVTTGLILSMFTITAPKAIKSVADQ
jgi:MFS family permease